MNEEDYRAHWVKDFVAADRFEDNSFMFVWLDTRPGVPAIYGQRLGQSGAPEGTNFRVQTSNPVLPFRPPALACVDSGQFIVLWEGEPFYPWRLREIYVQRFGLDGMPVSPAVVIDTTPYGQPAGAVGVGRLLIAWPDSHSVFGWRIMARLHSRLGQPLDTAVVVSDSGIGPYLPMVSSDQAGRFVAAWAARGNVYAQVFDSLGHRIGDNFVVNDSGTMPIPNQRDADVAWLSNGRMVFTYTGLRWKSFRTTVYARIIEPNGPQQTCSFRVSECSSPRLRPAHPVICTDGNGGFAVAWLDSRVNVPDIYAQWYDSVGNPQGPNTLVSDTSATTTWRRVDYPAVVANENKTIVAWRRRYSGSNHDLVFKVFDRESGQEPRSEYLNDDQGFAHQFAPSVAVGGDGRLIITWSDTRRKFVDIYAKRFDSLGNSLSRDFEVNQDTASQNFDMGSCVASNGSGYVIAWHADHSYNPSWWRHGLMGQKYALDGMPIGTNLWISESLYNVQLNPSIAARTSTGYVVTWEAGEYPRTIMARRLDRDGDPLDTCFKVNDQGDWPELPDVDIGASGQFVIVWGGERLCFQRFDSSGARLGSNVPVDARVGVSPDVAYDADQNFVITWDAGLDIHAKRFTMAGDSIGSAFRVNDSAQVIDPVGASPAVVCRRPHEFFICYDVPWGWAYQILGQYYKDGSPVGGNRVINQSILDCNLEQPTMTADSERIYITWAGYKYEQNRYNYDVYAKIIKWDDLVDVEGEKRLEVLNRQFRIYPNPARVRVVIMIPDARYMIHDNENEKTSLKIYDITGRVVRSFDFASCRMDPAASLVWNGEDDRGRAVRNGVYFCQLKAGESVLSRKLVLLR